MAEAILASPLPVFGNRFAALFASLALSLLACVALASTASAETFVVNSLGDGTAVGGCLGSPDCTLRDAILGANAEEGADTIEFELAGVIHVEESPLPSINGPVTINATTVPGYSGRPLVEIDGTGSTNEGSVNGLSVYAGPTLIEGLAIGNFEDAGLETETENPVRVCASHIGANRSGTEAEPNRVGIEIDPGSLGAKVGAQCPGGVGNLISGNEFFGIEDRGRSTEIAANRIGADALGAPLPNGAGFEPESQPQPGSPSAGAGVLIGTDSEGAFVGPGPGEAGNAIAFNETVGILVAAGAQAATIGGNSIHSNTGLGIALEGEKPPLPLLTTGHAALAETSIEGSLEAEPGESYFVDFYANRACDPSGSGEGQTPLGGAIVKTNGTGKVTFSVDGLDRLPTGQDIVTATATPSGADGSTSEFSKCLTVAPFVAPIVKPALTSSILPINGETIVVVPQSGKILVKLPGEKKLHRLKVGKAIPVGSIVDATNGKVTLTSIDAKGNTQTATFFGGVFKVTQGDGKSLVVLRLLGGDFSSCGAGSSASVSKKAGRHLWGSGHGNFRSEGKHGSATVRGTIWLTEDRCDGTFFKVRRGVVTIRDFSAGRTLKLPAGKSYLAG
jgi:CSLREA domain-containing protein